MPTSHHRHRRSPFKRTSFQRTASISSSITSTSPSSDIPPTPTPTHQPSIQHPPSATPAHMHSPPAPLTTKGREEIKRQEEDQRTNREIFGYQSFNPGLGHSSSRASSVPFRDIDLQLSMTSSPSSSVHHLSSAAPELGFWMSASDLEPRANSNQRSHGKHSIVFKNMISAEAEEKEPKHQEYPPKKKSLRPFLRKCVHSFSFRSSFRLIGWIEDPVVLGDRRGLYRYEAGHAYGGEMGDARLWDEARRGAVGG